MGSWATASIFVASIIWLQTEANPDLFQNGFLGQWELMGKANSASTLQDHNGPSSTKAKKHLNEQLVDRYFVVEPVDDEERYHKDSLGAHSLQTRQLEYGGYYEAPQHELQSYGHEEHGEVHYHQHKHVHKHDHKQEHKHQHKNDHKHEHAHKQDHKHSHQAGHKHEHEHKHDHHQGHKHDHHHDHKHGHHHQHKHGHHHGHKQQHHNQHKHQHKHGHKHGHKHSHHHKHQHKHSKHG